MNMKDETPAGERQPIDANALEAMAKARPDEMFLKGSGVLKLIGGIRWLESELRSFRAVAPQPPTAQPVAGAVRDAGMSDAEYIDTLEYEVRRLGALLHAPAGDAAMPIDTDQAREYLVKLFADRIERHDFRSYIRDELAGDFAFVLAQWLNDQVEKMRNDTELLDAMEREKIEVSPGKFGDWAARNFSEMNGFTQPARAQTAREALAKAKKP